MIANKILKSSFDVSTNEYNRTKVGIITGIIGIILNTVLCLSKFSLGFLTNSVAIMADAINNLSDAMSSCIIVLGFKISSAPADKDHPYGHGRAEYITAFVLSIIIIFVGFQFVKTAINRIINPEIVNFSKISVVILIISIIVKFFISRLNKKLGKEINSDLLMANSYDSLSDCFTTGVVLLSMFLNGSKISFDGIIGVLISIYIVYSGISIAKNTVSYLLGESPDDELIKNVIGDIKKYDSVLGVHKVKFHTYGKNNTIANADVEIDASTSFVKVHNLITVIEKEIFEKYNISLAIHPEPIGGEFTEREIELKTQLDKYFLNLEFVKSIHDFAIYKSNNQSFVALEVVVDGNKINKNFKENNFKNKVKQNILKYDNELNVIISILYDYI